MKLIVKNIKQLKLEMNRENFTFQFLKLHNLAIQWNPNKTNSEYNKLIHTYLIYLHINVCMYIYLGPGILSNKLLKNSLEYNVISDSIQDPLHRNYSRLRLSNVSFSYHLDVKSYPLRKFCKHKLLLRCSKRR